MKKNISSLLQVWKPGNLRKKILFITFWPKIGRKRPIIQWGARCPAQNQQWPCTNRGMHRNFFAHRITGPGPQKGFLPFLHIPYSSGTLLPRGFRTQIPHLRPPNANSAPNSGLLKVSTLCPHSLNGVCFSEFYRAGKLLRDYCNIGTPISLRRLIFAHCDTFTEFREQ